MSQPITILSVENDDDDAEILAGALEQVRGKEYRLHRARSLGELQGAIASTRPDVILLDLHLPDSGGAETVAVAMRHAGDIPVLVLTGSSSEELGRKSIDAGVQDFIPKAELFTPYLSRSIDFAIRRKTMLRDAERRAATDPLTGLSNRAGLMRQLGAMTTRVRRHGGGFAVAVVDLDGFKAINDRYGHGAGDAVLIEVSKRAQALARANDYLCRLGGDEFVFCLDGANTRAKARDAASRFAAAVEKPMLLADEFGAPRVAVGASFGLSVCPKDSCDPAELLNVADQAMYARKTARRAGADRPPSARSQGAGKGPFVKH